MSARHTGIQVKLDMRILLPLGRVVVRPALDYLHIAQRYAGRGILGRNKTAQRDDGRDCEGDGGEETEDILHPHQIRVHGGCVSERSALCKRVGYE